MSQQPPVSGSPLILVCWMCEPEKQHHDVQFGLIHISAGDLLRAEVEAGTEAGKLAAGYMNNGQLVPNKVVVDMVKHRLAQPDVQGQGWLLDGYPRSADQAAAILEEGIHPDVFLLIQVRQAELCPSMRC